MVASHAANPNCMYLWMDYAASPEVQARFTESQHQAPVGLVACQLMTDPDACTALHAADDGWWEDVDYWTTPSEDCGDPARDRRARRSTNGRRPGPTFAGEPQLVATPVPTGRDTPVPPSPQ